MTAAEVKDDSEESLVNREKVEQAVRMILEAIGENPDREGLHDTPARVARMYEEIFSGLHRDPSEVLSARFHVDHDEVVLVKDIPFYSSCEHHLLPFFGEAHVAYLPRHGVVTGLSKLARLVDIVAKRPQIQERMTNIIADTLENDLDAVGVMVVIEAEHLCMTMRGIKKPGSKTVTMASRGAYEDSARQQEILRMLNLS
ncbi:MAG: GTP cyclohydrolase I FolE [Firmicutes bacterium]|uniref:GTP cyclohydrolase 1 n=1 Tax=Sulfobacillus benefaciens TaxID=453960 RepID=A0A2T2X7K3_9FIRM|nr:GTP cyclohydrolase I FolE [Bacillota bacterium]MCL5013669.1 GTP cyclohydrolase I FolE [Bacillota bacterium]PSR30472.1 MAG: GTP cyclohydrolase I FolE [Sulfobacillus benefaciens]HBQ94096.1 GTP cyclohydrolase I FolE [Sulfobacillus sp.]